MTVAVSILPSQQLAALNEAYRKAVARKRLRITLGAAVFFAALVVASVGAEVNLRTLFTYFGHFFSYFDRIATLENGQRVWTDIGEWLWGWRKWSFYLGETILISYVGTLLGAYTAWRIENDHVDQDVLSEAVWPIARQSILIHDSVFAPCLGSVPFPPFGSLPPGHHVGENAFLRFVPNS